MSKKTSASARLNLALARIASSNLEGSKVFVDLFAETALRDATASDERFATGCLRGPLDGRIVSVKALFDIAGHVTQPGSKITKNASPAADDAIVVKRLRAAGAIVIGRTQMTEFAFSAIGTNEHYSVPGNPHDRLHAPGGSSSGAVVSVVDGMAEIAIGSDTGGSVRIPAGLSGAVGFKPTGGRVPMQGVFPLSTSLDTVGPIASNVADCSLINDVIAGGQTLPAAPTPSRLVVARGRLFEQSEAAVLSAFEQGLDVLRNAGVSIRDGSMESILDHLAEIDKIGTFPSIELGATLLGLGYANLDGVQSRIQVRIAAGAGILAVDYVRMLRLRQAAIQSFEKETGSQGIFVLPTTPIRAPLLALAKENAPFQELNGLLLRNPRIANLLDCPSISIPLPVTGLPVGMMLIGRRNSDKGLLAVASLVERVLACQA